MSYGIERLLLPLLGAFIVFAALSFTFVAIVRKFYRLPSDIHNLTGEQFERFVAEIFRRNGYSVRETGSRKGDFGCDLLISRAGQTTAVQLKRWKKAVGIGAVREALGARDFYKANDAIVVTSSTYTEAAVRQAKASGITLRDGVWLAGQLREAKKNVKRAA